MNTIELRHHIIEKLSLIDDDSFLKAIKTIVESKVNEGVYKLSDFQKKRIDSGREQSLSPLKGVIFKKKHPASLQ
jgi:hypothetical protein